MHVEVVADRAYVIVGRMVEEPDRRGQHGRVFSAKGRLGRPLQHELDEPLVRPGHQEHVEREGPEHRVGRLDGPDRLAQRRFVLLESLDVVADRENRELVLGEFLLRNSTYCIVTLVIPFGLPLRTAMFIARRLRASLTVVPLGPSRPLRDHFSKGNAGLDGN